MDGSWDVFAKYALCEGHGLATCAQGYWTFFETVRQTTGASDLMLACGIAIDLKIKMLVNKVRSSRCVGIAIFIDK